MKIFKRVRDALPGWRSRAGTGKKASPEGDIPQPESSRGDEHLILARESLRELAEDPRVPPEIRATLADDYRQVRQWLDKLEQGQVHIAAFGRVSVGKSALLNALLGQPRFATSPLHGETRTVDRAAWQTVTEGGVELIDTPGINEVAGEERERLAREVAQRADLVLFVVDGDLTDTEHRALETLAQLHRPLLLVLNKADRYSQGEREQLLAMLAQRSRGLVSPGNLLACAADPAQRTVIRVDEAGRETSSTRRPPVEVDALRERLWAILHQEGKTLAALNASLFAGHFSDRLAREIMATRRQLAERLVRSYCLGKGVAVAVNPVPLADLLTVAADAAMIRALSRVYGLPVTRAQAGRLLGVIMGQLALVMGTVWGVHLLSSALKGVSLGLSTVVTASAQGAVAWYGTYLVGRASERYFAQGASWGPGGPKTVVREILDSLDRDSLLAQAREDILARLKAGKTSDEKP